MDAQNSAQEVRVRNVSLLRRGKTEIGTLILTAHHLIFSYHPAAARAQVNGNQLQTAGSSASTLGQEAARAVEATSSPKTAKTPAKEIYVPFPLINRCQFRPSGAINGARLQSETPGDAELFPPTVGTSSYTRTSTDSTRNHAVTTSHNGARAAALRIRCKDSAMFALHFSSPTMDKSTDDVAREVFYTIRDRTCVPSIRHMYAYTFAPPPQETQTGGKVYDARKEFARMGIRAKAPDGPGSSWRITEINHDYSYSPTYPSVIAVPKKISDNILKYSGAYRSKARIPALTYLHTNGGTISRASQPFSGFRMKRNAQDEKLVQAIFTSHLKDVQVPSDSPPQRALQPSASSTSLNDADVDTLDAVNEEEGNVRAVRQRIYGSTHRSVIIDARPYVNMVANRTAGGGFESVEYYGTPDIPPIDKLHLNIANIHTMRQSLEKVIAALGSSDYLELAPDQTLLRKSEWLYHIALLLDGAEMIARVVGLGGSHALIHCSDGWDRTSQACALAEIMLDPYYRTLEGFITLIQKDFLSFGHKFEHRQGTEGYEDWFDIEGERALPLRSKGDSDSNLQAIGQKTLSNARSWFERQQNIFRSSTSSKKSSPGTSRPTTPPANPLVHSTPTPAVQEASHKVSIKEVSPIFHQFLDSVYQLLEQEPNAFEFNERFLRRLLYQSYSGQYGEFLFNCEKERNSQMHNLPSVWANFLARKQEFVNVSYSADTFDGLLFPRRRGLGPTEVHTRWWASNFGRQDEEMNIPPPPVFEIPVDFSREQDAHAVGDLPTQTTPPPAEAEETMHGTPPSTSQGSAPRESDVVVVPIVGRDRAASVTSDQLSIDGNTVMIAPVRIKDARLPNIEAMQIEGDPLGVSEPRQSSFAARGGLDFAAFAQQNAFSER